MALKNSSKTVIGGLTLLMVIASLNYKINILNGERLELQNTISKIENKIDVLENQIKEKDELIQEINKELEIKEKELEDLNKKYEEVNEYKYNTSKVKSSSYNVYESEVDLIERVVYCEAKGESEKGQIAVVNVILNRLNDDNFPNTVTDIIYQKNQFSPVSNGAIWKVTPDDKVKQSVQKALQGAKVISDESVYFFATWVRDNHPIRNHVAILETVGVHHFGKSV